MKPINYAKLVLAVQKKPDDPRFAEALSQIVLARAEGSRGLGERVDAVLAGLLVEIEAT